jgi:hypothetical protein
MTGLSSGGRSGQIGTLACDYLPVESHATLSYAARVNRMESMKGRNETAKTPKFFAEPKEGKAKEVGNESKASKRKRFLSNATEKLLQLHQNSTTQGE